MKESTVKLIDLLYDHKQTCKGKIHFTRDDNETVMTCLGCGEVMRVKMEKERANE